MNRPALLFAYALLVAYVPLCASAASASEPAPRKVMRADQAPRIDGVADDSAWATAEWIPIQHTLVGSAPADAADFRGRYRLLWSSSHLYLLAEIEDDVLFDRHADPLDQYWDDDALEILVDPDGSGGPHQFDDGAYAYHIALDNQVVDIGPANAGVAAGPRLYNDHLESAWRRSQAAPHAVIWELAIRLIPEPQQAPGDSAQPDRALSLVPGMQLGFAVAYCDADSAQGRKRLIADVNPPAVNGDRNLLYLDASTFGRIQLLP